VHSAFEKPQFFVHVNSSDLIRTGDESILEVNGSFESTKLRARLYTDYSHFKFERTFFQSGDVLRLQHKEARGYLTTLERDVELSLPALPDFLQREVNRYSDLAAEASG